MPTPVETVNLLWAQIQARDWAALREVLADDLVVDWPASAERFRGADNFVAIQREYPEGWSIRVLRVQDTGDGVVSEVEVPFAGGDTYRAVTFWTVQAGKITGAVEYWITLGAEQPPLWREKYSTPLPTPSAT